MFSSIIAFMVLIAIGFLAYYIINWNRKNKPKMNSNINKRPTAKLSLWRKRKESPLISESVSKLDEHICNELFEDDEEEKGA